VTDRSGSSLAIRAVAHERDAAAVVGSAFPHTSLNTLQADALKLVAKKLQSFLAVEGELPEDGLAAYGRVRRRSAAAHGWPARQQRNGGQVGRACLRLSHDRRDRSRGSAVDGEWQAEERLAVDAHRSGTNGNGQHAQNIKPTVELIPGNDHRVNGDRARPRGWAGQ